MYERWKVLKNYPDYAVSNYGNVKRITPGKPPHGNNCQIGKILSAKKDGSGYLQIGIVNKDGIRKFPKIHKLVAGNFIKCPKDVTNEEKITVNHKDGIKVNNCWLNLEYCSLSENHKHAFRMNLRNNEGSNNPPAKLKESEVTRIKKLLSEDKFTQVAISRMFGVCPQTIGMIKNGANWSGV